MTQSEQIAVSSLRILSLDGGGTWALIQVRALRRLFEALRAREGRPTGDVSGHDVLRRFDLVVANSGGSLVAASLAADLELSQIEEMFLDPALRRAIFVRLPLFDEVLASTTGATPRYSTEDKLPGIRRALSRSLLPGFVNLSMSDWAAAYGVPGYLARIVIVGFDYMRERAQFFRTHPASAMGLSSLSSSVVATFAEAAHASSDAPVRFFDAPAKAGHRLFWDGAIAGLNNPTLAGVVELLGDEAPELRRTRAVRVLSIGTGLLRLADTNTPTSGWIHDLGKLASSVLDDPPDSAGLMAHVILGGRLAPYPVEDGPVVRMNPAYGPARNGVVDLPGLDARQCERLATMEMDAVKDDEVEIISMLTDGWLNGQVDNQPLKVDRNGGLQIGHARFNQALTAALAFL